MKKGLRCDHAFLNVPRHHTWSLYLVLCRLFVCLFLSFNSTSYSYENTYMTVQLRGLSTLRGSVVCC
jgi:hypothetical protein